MIRDIPPRRNLYKDYEYSSSSRTGGGEHVRDSERYRARANKQQRDKEPVAKTTDKKKHGTFTKQYRKKLDAGMGDKSQMPLGGLDRKKRTKQVWLPVQVQAIGEESSESAGKRKRTNSVFDRLEAPSSDPAVQGRREQ